MVSFHKVLVDVLLIINVVCFIFRFKRVTDKQNNDTQLYETGYIPLIQQLSRNEPRKNKTESHEHEKNSCSRFHANLVFPINSQIGRQHTVTER